MIKVCHMTSAHGVEDGRIFQKECTSLAKAGYEVYLVERGASYDKNGVHIVGVGEIPSSRLKRMTIGTKKVYEAARALDADVYHLHDPELLPYVSRFKKAGKRVVFDSHENTLHQMKDKEWLPKALRSFVSVAYNYSAVKAMRQCDALVTVTPSVLDELRIINPNTVMVTNYPFFRETDEKENRNWGEFSICYTGGISAQWDLERICEAISDVDRVSFHICGEASQEIIDSLILASSNKVVYLGKVTHSESWEIQRNCCVGIALLIPSNNTGGYIGTLGNTKLFEYMNAGIPVVCTRFDLWQDIIDRYHCGLTVDPLSVKEIHDAIIYLRDHVEDAKQMGKNGRRAVEEEFNWGEEEKKLLALYCELLNG